MQRILTFLIFSLIVFSSFSQKITVLNENTNEPIPSVFIYHESQKAELTIETNGKGVADLSIFPSGIILLQHPSYQNKSIKFEKKNLTVKIKEHIIQTNEVVVAANKWEQNANQVSQQITSVTKKSIEFENPQTSADLIASSGQVFVQKSQLGGGSPKIRGFAANGVLLVVDGIRMNNAIFRSGNLQNIINIDANAVESSEVIFGPGSVTYGSDAMGGVMDFHTIRPKWGTKTANGLFRYSSAANERTGHIDFSISNQKINFFHSTSFTAFGDLKAGSKRTGLFKNAFIRKHYASTQNGKDILIPNQDINLQKQSGYQLFNTISKIRTKVGKFNELEYGFYLSSTSNIPRYDNLTLPKHGKTDSLKYAKWEYGPQKWQMHRLTLNRFKKSKLFNELKINIAYQRFVESRIDRKFGSNKERKRTEKVDMFSFNRDAEKNFNKVNLYYGLDIFYNKVHSTGITKNIGTGENFPSTSRYPNLGSSYLSFASYVNTSYNPNEKLTLSAGLRYNRIRMTASTNDSLAQVLSLANLKIINGSLNGAIGLAYRPEKRQKISINIASGFRAPNVDDAGKIFEVGKKITIPNPNLKPEKSISNEIGYDFSSDKFNLNIVGFYSFLFDVMIDAPTTINNQTTYNGLNIFHKTNASKANIYGTSLSAKFAFHKNWAFASSVTYTDGKDLTNNQPLRHTSPLFGKVTLAYQKKKLKTELYTLFNGERTASQIPDSEIKQKPHLYTSNGSPSWATLNWKMSYQFTKHISLNLGIENILDKHYRPYSSGISASGRNFIIALRGRL